MVFRFQKKNHFILVLIQDALRDHMKTQMNEMEEKAIELQLLIKDKDADLAEWNEKVRTALRHLRFSTATVPFTDGHKMRLHHFGCAMNDIFGLLTVFLAS